MDQFQEGFRISGCWRRGLNEEPVGIIGIQNPETRDFRSTLMDGQERGLHEFELILVEYELNIYSI